MKLKSTIAAIALAATGATAFAQQADQSARNITWNADYSVGTFYGNYTSGQTVDDRFGFTVFEPSYVTASLITNSLDSGNGTSWSDFNFSSASLNNSDFTDLNVNSSGLQNTDVEAWALGRTRLDAGTYFLSVAGTAAGQNGGAFSGVINVSPVPEPETYALMLAGLGVVGFLARRRQKS